MLTLMREMSVICVSNLTSSLTRTLLLPTEMNLDNTFVGLLPPFFQPCFCIKKQDSFGCRSEPSDKKCKKLQWVDSGA